MTRLTNSHRDKIRAMIIDHKFRLPIVEFNKEQTALGCAVYNRLYLTQQRSLMDQLVKHSGKTVCFAQRSKLNVNVGGWKVELTLPEASNFLEAHEQHYNPVLSLTEDDELGGRVRDYAERRKAMEAEKKHLEGQTDRALSPYYTFDKLSASWPEIDRFVRAVEVGADAPRTEVALASHDALNAALDLPPETKAA